MNIRAGNRRRRLTRRWDHKRLLGTGKQGPAPRHRPTLLCLDKRLVSIDILDLHQEHMLRRELIRMLSLRKCKLDLGYSHMLIIPQVHKQFIGMCILDR